MEQDNVKEETKNKINEHENQENKNISEDSKEENVDEQNIPEQEETLEGWIETVNENDIPELLKNTQLFKEFCDKLLRIFSKLEKKEIAFEQLLRVTDKISVGSRGFLEVIEKWLGSRKKLIGLIKKDIEMMDIMTKVCSTARVFTSVTDTASLVWGLVVGKPSERANQVSNAFELLNIAASITELYTWKEKMNRLMKEIKLDQELFSPIQEWYRENFDLENALNEIFPFELTSRLAMEFEKNANDELSQLELFQLILRPILHEDKRRLKDINLIRNLIAFTSCPAATDWCRWIIFRHHRVSLEIESIMLQLISPQRFTTLYNSSAIMEANPQTPFPGTIARRVCLNVLSIYDAVSTLKNGGIVEELTQLYEHLKREMKALTQIAKLIRNRRKHALL